MSLARRLLSAILPTMAPSMVQRPLVAILGAEAPVGHFADAGATCGAKAALPPFLV
jgi:hypothetical protein